MALLGPSGSGKSTVLKLIAGIEQPEQGDIRLDGQSILRVPANQRGAVLMFQKAYLFPFLNVADNIAFGLKVKKVNRATRASEVARMLDLIGLPGIERRFPAQLSGGEQQRVALARALVTHPRVLMLDEPLSSLDTAVRQSLQEAIREIQRRVGITTLLVTHDLSEAMTMSDRTALLLGGHIVACEPPARLFQRPPTRAAAQFMGVSTFFRGRVRAGHLESAVGCLCVGGPPPATSEATFAIRPEHVLLQREPGPNTLPGVIRDVIFKGEGSEFRVTVGDGMEVRARLFHPCATLAPGEPLFVHFPAAHLFEVQEDEP